MATVVVHVWLPDRPGALGQVASRIGAVRGDVLGIEVLERGGGRVVDELTVELPDADLITLLTNEIGVVDGVSVESVRLVDDDRMDPDLAALAAGAALAECAAADRMDVLCSGVQRMIEADWVIVLRGSEPIGRLGNGPDDAWLLAFLAGTEHLAGVGDTAAADLLWANLLASGMTIAAGRSERSIHERERVRVSLFARLADALLLGERV